MTHDREEQCVVVEGRSLDYQAALVSESEDGRTLSLVVYRWKGVHDGARQPIDVALTLYECDEGVSGEGEEDLVLARFSLRLEPGQKRRDGTVGPCGVTRPRRLDITPAVWTDCKDSRSKEWFSLKLGGRWAQRVHLPEDVSDLEGAYHEIGFTLEAQAPGGETVRLDRLWRSGAATGATASVKMRVLLDEHWRPDWTGGAPTVTSDQRTWRRRLCEFEPWGRLHAGQEQGVELDGRAIEPYLPGERRAFVRQFAAENPTVLAARAIGADPQGRALAEATGLELENLGLGLWDMAKAYFVIHDTGAFREHRHAVAGVARARSGPNRFGVHGFLDADGTYVPAWDFLVTRSGAVFDRGTNKSTVALGSRRGAEWFRGYGIHIEVAPPIVQVPTVSAARRTAALRTALQETFDRGDVDHVTVGYHPRKGYTYLIGWTTAIVEALADLYIFASARAGQLLTVTGHQEMDRNLVRRVLEPEWLPGGLPQDGFTAEQLATSLKTLAGQLHADPRGFDMAALYAAITRKLGQLKGGFSLASSEETAYRYGIHPSRIRRPPSERRSELAALDEALLALPEELAARVGINLGNMGGSTPHSFPRQSAPWGT